MEYLLYSVGSIPELHLASVPASGAAAAAAAVVAASAGSDVCFRMVVLVYLDSGYYPVVVGTAVVPLFVACAPHPAVLDGHVLQGTAQEAAAVAAAVVDGKYAVHS